MTYCFSVFHGKNHCFEEKEVTRYDTIEEAERKANEIVEILQDANVENIMIEIYDQEKTIVSTIFV